MTTTIGLADILLISPIIALFLFSLLPLTAKVLNKNKEQNDFISLITGLLGLGTAGFLLIMFGGSDQLAFNGQLLFDGMTKWAGLISIIAASLSLVLVYENPSTHKEQFSEILFLIMSSVSGMILLISAVNLITVFVGLELMSLPLYLLVALSHEQKYSKEAAIKYFVLGSFASALFLYGTSFIYGSAQTLSTVDLMQMASTGVGMSKIFLFGMLFVILGFAFKVSIAPFHAWTPDVYQGAPTPMTAFMASAVKTASFAAFLRIAATQVFQGSQNLLDVIQWLAVITMTVGNVAALVQTNFKRTLAYSSIANSGYMLVGLIAVGISPNSSTSAGSVMFYLFSYSLMTIGAFAIISLIEKDENDIITTERLAGFAKKQPLLAICLTVFMLSMAGIPPLLGFFSKFYLFSSAVNEGLMWLALWGVINSAIGVYYYLKPIVIMFMKDGDCDIANSDAHGTMIVVILSAALVVILGLFSSGIYNMIVNGLG